MTPEVTGSQERVTDGENRPYPVPTGTAAGGKSRCSGAKEAQICTNGSGVPSPLKLSFVATANETDRNTYQIATHTKQATEAGDKETQCTTSTMT